MTTVMAFGTFDLLHPGHKYFLRQAKKQGDYLIAIIARDSTVKKIKGKLPRQSENERRRAVLDLNLADKAVLGDKGLNKYRVIEKYRPDVIVLGYDQMSFVLGLKDKIKDFKLKTKIIRLKPYQAHKYKTSIIKNIKTGHHMKITICGSVKFADKIVAMHKRLADLGHEPQIHRDMFGIADGTAKELIDAKNNGEHHQIKIKYNFIKAWYDLIKNGDAVLICNFDKNGIKNYIGGNTLMEIGFAHVNDKKIFLLNPIPEKVSYVDEIKAMANIILNGDLNKII